MSLLNGLANGLSQMGGAISDYAGKVGLEQQKADLEAEQITLQNTLVTARESAGRQETGAINAAAATVQSQRAKDQASFENQLPMTAAQQSDAQYKIGSLAVQREGQTPQEVRVAQWLATATPAQKQAYQQAELAKAGVPLWVAGAGGDTSTGGGTSAGSSAPASGSGVTPPVSGSPQSPASSSGQADKSSLLNPPADNGDVTGTADNGGTKPGSGSGNAPSVGADGLPLATTSNFNQKALANLPPAAQITVKAMVDGRIPPPTGMALAKPYWQALIGAAGSYDPTFDETSWAGRVATRKDASSGKLAQGITALYTALGHAGVVAGSFDALDNFGGIGTPLNAPKNWLDAKFGGDAPTNAQEAVGALASEARKVFSASGGGNLTELEEWQKNFPINGSPEQQKGALKQFVGLLDSRLQSLGDQWNRGMQRTDEPMNLLEPHAREVYQQLTGQAPDNATVGTGAGGATPGKSVVSLAPNDPAQREVGKAYISPTGMKAIWTGNGWQAAH